MIVWLIIGGFGCLVLGAAIAGLYLMARAVGMADEYDRRFED